MNGFIFAKGAVYPMTKAGLDSFIALVNGLDEGEAMQICRCNKKDCKQCENWIWYGGKKECDYFTDPTVPGHIGYCFGFKTKEV